MARQKKASNGVGNGATLGFEAKLWQTADALRNNMDAAEHKHVVLGLIAGVGSPLTTPEDSTA